MKKVFRDPLEEKISRGKKEFNHTIILTINTLSKIPIILMQSDNHAFVKKYLDSMLRKEYIQISMSSMEAPLFLVLKKEGKQPVINY